MKNKVKWIALSMSSVLLLSGCGAPNGTQATVDTQISNATIGTQENTSADASTTTEESTTPNVTDITQESTTPNVTDITEENTTTDATQGNTITDENSTLEEITTPDATNASETTPSTDTIDSSIETSTSESGEELTQQTVPIISIVEDTKEWYLNDSTVIVEDTKEWYLDDNTVCLLGVSSSVVSVENEGFDALEASLSEHFGAVQEADYEEWVQTAKEEYDLREEEDKEYFYGYSNVESAELARSDSFVVSLRIFYSDYTGGTHGMYAYGGKTFDVESGELLDFADILIDAEGFYPKATEYISAKLYEEYSDELYPEYEEYVAGTFDADRSINWYLNAAGIVIIYNPYEVGPYSMGAPEILLPYSEFADYINEKHLSANAEIIAKVPINQNISKLLGEKERILIETSYNEWEMLVVKVVSGTSVSELGSFGRLCDAYIIKRADGKSFLFVECDYMSDDLGTFVYEVTNGTLQKCCELPDASVSGEYMATDKIGIAVQLDVLGSYNAKMDYILDENGQFIQANDIFTINTANTMTITKELPVSMNGADTTLSVGTQIVVTGTNNIDEVYFRILNSDQTGTIHYTKEEDSWIHLIDGISEYEYFETIYYVG